jgi:hypothetical protein
MKKLQFILFSAAMIGLCSLVQAQDPDSASNNMNNPAATEQSDDNTQSDDQKTEEAETPEQEDPQSTDQQLQNDADAMKENFEGSTIDKVGPNGEQLFMERGRYYYYDEDGKKVKVKKSEVRDKSQSDQPR